MLTKAKGFRTECQRQAQPHVFLGCLSLIHAPFTENLKNRRQEIFKKRNLEFEIEEQNQDESVKVHFLKCGSILVQQAFKYTNRGDKNRNNVPILIK